MARITIIIEDVPGEGVRLIAEPDLLGIYSQIRQVSAASPAETYAIAAWEAMLTIAEMSANKGELLLQ